MNTTEGELSPEWIPLEFLQEITDPTQTDVWGCGVVSLETIAEANHNPEPWRPSDPKQIWSKEQHAARVRYLADFGWDQEKYPIQIDVGVPALGYFHRVIDDGHHRLAALIYRKSRGEKLDRALCEVQGQVGSYPSFGPKTQESVTSVKMR